MSRPRLQEGLERGTKGVAKALIPVYETALWDLTIGRAG